MEGKRVSFSVCCGLCQNLPLFTFWMNVSIVYQKKGPFFLRMVIAHSSCSFRPAPRYFGNVSYNYERKTAPALREQTAANTHLWTPDCPLAEVTLSPLPPLGHPSQPPVGTVFPQLQRQRSQTPRLLTALYPEPAGAWVSNTSLVGSVCYKEPKDELPEASLSH